MLLRNYFPQLIILVSLLSFIGFNTCNGQALYPFFNKNDKWGYLDTTGKVIIAPQFGCALKFSEGVGLIKKGNKWGYIDSVGNYIFQPVFDSAYSFSNGLGLVFKDSLCGFIDKTGNYAIKPVFYDASGFSDGIASVSKVNGKWYFIDKKGHRKIRKYSYSPYNKVEGFPYTSAILFFHDGLVNIEDCLMDKKGKRHYFSNADMDNFSDDRALFKDHNKYGYINKDHDLVIGIKYLAGSAFVNGHAWVLDSLDSKYVLKYINNTDSTLFQCNLDHYNIDMGKTWIFHLHNGLCLMYLENKAKERLTVYFNSKGDVLEIPFDNWTYSHGCEHYFDFRTPYKIEDQLFLINVNGVYKYINFKGDMVWESEKIIDKNPYR